MAAAFAQESNASERSSHSPSTSRPRLHPPRHLLCEDDYLYANQHGDTDGEEGRGVPPDEVRRTPSSWNLPGCPGGDTLDALADHLGRQSGEPAKILLWARNSHPGDVELGAQGEVNVRQHVRGRALPLVGG